MSDSPARILLDVSGSQVGTSGNPFFISGTLTSTTTVVNNIYTNVVPGADPSGSFVLVQTTGSIPNGQAHELLRQLIHFDDADGPRGSQWASGLVKDTDTTTPFPTGSVWWTDVTRTLRVADVTITRNSQKLPTVIQWKAYQNDGVTVAESYTDTITYSGVEEKTRVRTQP